MARKPRTDATPTHVFFQAALAEGVPATYAHTLAHCLYWFQKTQHMVDGRPAIYKTGRELSGKLGLAARTINSHLKKMAKMGYWHIEYRARPNHPSPVSWLVLSDKSMELMSAVSSHPNRETRSLTTGCLKGGHSSEQMCDVRMLEDDTTYRDTDRKDSRADRSFIRENEDRRNETSRDRRRWIRAPKNVGASEELEMFVNGVSKILDELGLEPWDTASGYTWEHSRKLRGKLFTLGHENFSDQIELVSRIIFRWSDLRFVMEDRYAHHSGNRERPTPMALCHQFKRLVAAVQEPTRNADQSTWSQSSLDGDFR